MTASARPRSFQNLIALAICSLFLAMPAAGQSLRPSHEADRLLMATEQAFADGNYNQAEEHLNQVNRLGVSPPLEYEYLYGKLLSHRKRYPEARTHLEAYVNRAGREGVFYRDALALITDIEKQSSYRQQAPQTQARAADAKSDLQWSSSSREYIERIQKLYNSNDAKAALTLHVNNLLKFYAYGDERVIAGSRLGTPSRHQIFTTPEGELVSVNKVGGSKDDPYREDRFPVFGVNPYLSYQCNYGSASCWILHPVTSERWLQIVENEEAAEELAKAMSELLKNMQQTG